MMLSKITFNHFLFAVFLGMLLSADFQAAFGQLTLSGQLSPAYDGSDPWNVDGSLSVGNRNGDGTLTVTNGSQVFSEAGFIASANWISSSDPFVTGTATIAGSGSSWEVTESLSIGNLGNGTLRVLDGGYVSVDDVAAGSRSVTTGEILIDGAGALLEASDFTRIGIDGSGVLNIRNGGRATTRVGELGRDETGTGTATVSGSGSEWDISSFFDIGEDGSGFLSVLGGGTVNSSRTNLGCSPDAAGEVLIDGIGSTLTSEVFLYVGDQGQGTLIVTNGGSLNSERAEVGASTGGTGVVRIQDAGSTWTESTSTYVGSTSEVNIESEGVADLARVDVFKGKINVTGVGSSIAASEIKLRSGGALNVADQATANLGRLSTSDDTSFVTVDQAVINTDVLRVGNNSLLGTGVVNTKSLVPDFDLVFDSPDDAIQQFDYLDVSVNLDASCDTGSMGAGLFESVTMLVANGFALETSTGAFGLYNGSDGTGIVTGTGSVWRISDVLQIGVEGTGTLHILDGGLVTADSVEIARYFDSKGSSVLVDGAGSRLDVSNDLDFKFQGGGEIAVRNGGFIKAGSLDLSTDTLIVEGPASTVETSVLTSYIASNIDASDGAEIITNSVSLNYDASSLKTLTLRGENTRWTNSGNFFFGNGNASVLAGAELRTFKTALSGHATLLVSDAKYLSLSDLVMGGGTLNGATNKLVVGNDADVRVENIIFNASSRDESNLVELAGGVLDLDGGSITANEGALATIQMTGGILLNASRIDLGSPFVQDGGRISVGSSPKTTGIVGDFTSNGGEIFIELSRNGLAGVDYDQIWVEGLVDLVGEDGLRNSELLLSLELIPLAGQEFVILQNDGTDLVNGQFSNGSRISSTFNGRLFEFEIDYRGGDGNDIVLRNIVGSPFLLGDCDQNGDVDFLDIPALIAILINGSFLEQADCNQDGEVNFSDIPPFVAILLNT